MLSIGITNLEFSILVCGIGRKALNKAKSLMIIHHSQKSVAWNSSINLMIRCSLLVQVSVMLPITSATFHLISS